jgi:SAM-dependent methyltransferase
MSDSISVRAAYDKWAAIYDSDENATRDLDAAVLQSARLPLDDAAVIELGAGTGKNTAYHAARARRVIAFDLSPAMLDRARSRALGDHVSFIEHDITRPWPVADGEAGIVVGNLVLEHIADLRPIFAEARRALTSQGVMFLCELHPYRQLLGAQAQFQDRGRSARVEAYPHTVSEYLNTAFDQGLELSRLGEHVEPAVGSDRPTDVPPRLLSMLFHRP